MNQGLLREEPGYRCTTEPQDIASRNSSSASSSLFSIGNDCELKGGYPFDNLLTSVSRPCDDHLASKDQDTYQDTSSPQQTCLQIPTSMDPVINSSQGCMQGSSTTLWLQQDQTLQPALALPQGGMFQQQQSLDPSQQWVLSSQGLQQQAALDASSAQLQLQALQQGNGSLIDLNGLSVSLQGSSLMPMQQQGINATINGVPVILQVQNSTTGQGLQQLPSNMGLQPMQQVYVTPAEQQVYIAPAAEQQQTLLVNSNQITMQQAPTQVTLQPVQQQQVMASSAPSAGASTDTVLQLQQLQEAVQQLSSQTAAVQRVLATQGSQPQASQPQTVMLSMEGSLPAATSHPETQSMMSAQMTTGTANSPVSSNSGRDSMSSVSWHGLETLSHTSSPSYVAMPQHSRSSRMAPVASVAANATGSHSSSMLCIVSAPEMPQQMVQHQQQQQPQGARGGFSQAQVLPGSSTPAMMTHNWPAGAGMIPVSAGNRMTVPPPPAGGAGMGSQGPRGPYTAVYNQGPGMLMHNHYHQPGRISAPAGSGAYMQHPFRGNRPFSYSKVRQHSQGRAGSASGPLAAGAAGRITPVSSAVPANPATNPGPRFPGPWGEVSLEDGLKQLWSAEELACARGGRLYNVQQLAWHPVGDPDPTPQDMYNFQKLKRMVQKLDAVHKTRVKLIKRIHAVADHGECDLRGVYREVRGLIGEMLHDSAMMIKSLEQSRVTGLVRLALMLQEALKQGPLNEGTAAAPSSNSTAAVLSPIPAQPTVQTAVPAQAVQCA